LSVLLVGVGCGQETIPDGELEATPGPLSEGAALFEDRSELLPFVHWNGMTGEYLFPEMTGGGAALFDLEGDGDLDVFVVQGSDLGEGGEPVFPAAYAEPLVDRLYLNRLVETGSLGFSDITDQMAVQSDGYGMGVAAGDVDNDGRVDLYVTNFGANRLLMNRGDGRFVEATESAGVGDESWSVAAIFWDFDRDGWLDLFVGNYVSYTVATNKRCRAASGALDYCGPHSYPPVGDRLFRNLGDGTFEDATERLGLNADYGAALGVVTGDFDGDGWIDLYVANDGSENQLWMNRGGASFENVALLSGSALNGAGDPEAGMGVAAGDYDNDGDEDLFVAHLTQETSTLYRTDPGASFTDVTVQAGLGQTTWQATGFGTGWFDYDNDGYLDLLMANGAVKVIESLARESEPYPLHQKNQLFQNRAGQEFVETSTVAGTGFAGSAVSRGAAFGDLDNDGDTDLLIINNSGAASLLLNRSGERSGWLGLELLDRNGRPALGAWVHLENKGRSLWRRAASGGGYASANDPRLLFGLGDRSEAGTAPGAQALEVEVQWPDGESEQFVGLGADRYHRLQQGEGHAP